MPVTSPNICHGNLSSPISPKSVACLWN